MIDLFENEASLTFSVRVVTRASRTEIVGTHDDALKVRIASPPVDGAANAELVRYLAKKFEVSRSDVEIVSGLASKNKRVRVTGLTISRFNEVIK